MIYLTSLRLKKNPLQNNRQYPFILPLIQSLDTLPFESPVTFFVGENGTGKSTILEALAKSLGCPAIGNEDVQRDTTLEHVRELSKALTLTWHKKNHRGFFLRSEDFFNFTRRLSQMRSEMKVRLQELEEEYKDRSSYALSLAKMPFLGSLKEMESRYGENLDAHSHGESFLKLFQSRFVEKGIYLLDEPEAALSPLRQLSLISMIKEMVKKDCQFIISTHSPILMAYPGADIISFDHTPLQKVAYQELEHVNLTRSFLQNPEQYLRHL